MTAPICSFCGTSAVKARRFVRSDDAAAAICGTCIARCTEVLIADPKPDEALKQEGEARFPRIPSVSLENFLAAASWWVSCHVPPDTHEFVYGFLKSYAAAVRGIADSPWHQSFETPIADTAVEEAFEEMMREYRQDSRRSYLGATFSAVLGASIRQTFRDHVVLSRPRYGDWSSTEART